ERDSYTFSSWQRLASCETCWFLSQNFNHRGHRGTQRSAQREIESLMPQSDQCLFVNASTPGNCFPSRNSSDAPPPVEMWEILSATPAAFTAETESPPPTIEVAPAFSATACATLNVPLAKGDISKTPMGPFQTIVAARETSSENSSMDSGPISRPIRLSGMV